MIITILIIVIAVVVLAIASWYVYSYALELAERRYMSGNHVRVDLVQSVGQHLNDTLTGLFGQYSALYETASRDAENKAMINEQILNKLLDERYEITTRYIHIAKLAGYTCDNLVSITHGECIKSGGYAITMQSSAGKTITSTTIIIPVSHVNDFCSAFSHCNALSASVVNHLYQHNYGKRATS